MKRLLFASALAALAACHREAAEPDEDEKAAPIAVTCAPATASQASAAIELRGTVGAPPEQTAIVSAAVAGRVLEVRVREGDKVAAGALLATIDDPALSPAVAEGSAAVTAAEAALANADAALARANRLVQEGVAPRRDAEDAAAKRATAAAELATATAHRQLAQGQAARARVVAPIAGTVVRVLRRAGELVDGTAATPLLEIADPTALEIRTDAPAAQLVQLAVGQQADVALDALPGQALRAELVAVSPAIDPATALGSVRARLAAPPANIHLALGLAGTLRLSPPRATGAVEVPASALRRGMDGASEVVVCAGTTAKVMRVTVGSRSGDRVELATGLAVGQLVVIDHVLGLEDGAALAPAGAK